MKNELKPTVEHVRGPRSLEISTRLSSSPNVTVYRPERDRFTSKDEFKLTPGYINASSFQVKTEQDAVDLKYTLSAAIRELNDVNEVVPGWVEVENPWVEMEALRRQVEYLRSERGAKENWDRVKAAQKSAAGGGK